MFALICKEFEHSVSVQVVFHVMFAGNLHSFNLSGYAILCQCQRPQRVNTLSVASSMDSHLKTHLCYIHIFTYYEYVCHIFHTDPMSQILWKQKNNQIFTHRICETFFFSFGSWVSIGKSFESTPQVLLPGPGALSSGSKGSEAEVW